MQPIRLALTCCLLLACSACAPPKYWVPGLTLPAGASIVSQSETTNVQGMAAMLPFKGKVDKVLSVSFNSSGDWASVSSHIDGCMSAQGYSDQMAAMTNMMGGGAAPPGAAGMFSSMRMYTKDGAKYTVMLVDMAGTMAAASKVTGQSMPAGSSSLPGMGGYTLSVIRTLPAAK